MQLRDLFNENPVVDHEVYPLELQKLLREPLDVYADPARTERLLKSARERFPEHLELGVALYKMYAYSNRLDEALDLILEVLNRSAGQGGFPADWRMLKRDSARWHPAKGVVRCYLYTLKALGFVKLRLGSADEAYAVLSKLREIDSQDQVGSSIVFEMAVRVLDDDDAA